MGRLQNSLCCVLRLTLACAWGGEGVAKLGRSILNALNNTCHFNTVLIAVSVFHGLLDFMNLFVSV